MCRPLSRPDLRRVCATHPSLPGNDLDDAGAAAIARALPTSAVTHVELKLNKIGSAGVNAIAAALQKGARIAYLG